MANNLIECYILEEISLNKCLNISVLSKKTKCSRSIIVDKIQKLFEEEYIVINNDFISLTKKGYDLMLPMETIILKAKESIKVKQEYDWKHIYLPNKNIFD